MYSCGYLTGIEYDDRRSDWSNGGMRPLAWSVWYPTDEKPLCDDQSATDTHFFDPGEIVVGAKLSVGKNWPLVLLSHGTGGTAESLGWLARGLACRGYVVLGANHHGNTGIEPYSPEGSLCWWERATDLSMLLSTQEKNGPFSGRLDLDRVSAVGFSLGAYTTLVLAGAITSLSEFEKWERTQEIVSSGPREFPDAANHISRLLKASSTFRRSWDRHGENFRDARFRSFVAIAPPPPVRAFTEGSVRAISLPVTLIVGGADTVSPTNECASWLVGLNPRFLLKNLGDEIGHYTFLGQPTARALNEDPELFEDAEGVDRDAVHDAATKVSLNALA